MPFRIIPLAAALAACPTAAWGQMPSVEPAPRIGPPNQTINRPLPDGRIRLPNLEEEDTAERVSLPRLVATHRFENMTVGWGMGPSIIRWTGKSRGVLNETKTRNRLTVAIFDLDLRW